jgi:hypothetical protein
MTADTAFFSKVRPLALKAIVGSVIAAALVGVFSVLIGEFGPLSGKLLGTITLFIFFALCSWYDADVSAKRSPAFAVTSMGTTIYLLIAGMLYLWLPEPAISESDPYGYDSSGWGLDRFGSWVWITAVARVALLHAHILLVNKARFTTDAMQSMTKATLVLVVVLSIALTLPGIFTSTDFGELYWRFVGVVAILDVLGTILIPLIYSLFHRVPASERPPIVNQVPGAVYAAAPATAGPAAHLAPGAEAQPAAQPSAWIPSRNSYAPSSTQLQWPRYTNGQPLPAGPDGLPDFSRTYAATRL